MCLNGLKNAGATPRDYVGTGLAGAQGLQFNVWRSAIPERGMAAEASTAAGSRSLSYFCQSSPSGQQLRESRDAAGT